MDGLIIKKRWIDLILSGEKTWEVRGSNTRKRGTIALIESGSNKIVGLCDLVSSQALSIDDIKNKTKYHRLTKTDRLFFRYKKPHAWILENAKRIKPVLYNHPQGAVIWVKNVPVNIDVSRKKIIEKQLELNFETL